MKKKEILEIEKRIEITRKCPCSICEARVQVYREILKLDPKKRVEDKK